MKNLEKKVKRELSLNYGYNFTDGLIPNEISLMVEEVIEATAKILNGDTEKRESKLVCQHSFIMKDLHWEVCRHCGYLQPLQTDLGSERY